MGKANKRPGTDAVEEVSPVKRNKSEKTKTTFAKKDSASNKMKSIKRKSGSSEISETTKAQKTPFKKSGNLQNGNTKQKPFNKTDKKGTFAKQNSTQPVNWAEYKKKKKELRTKRRENSDLNDVLPKAKQLGEKIRRKTLQGGEEERSKIVAELHSLFATKGSYPKLVLTHDMARLVQYILKFGTPQIREEVSKELVPITVDMLQSKYGKFCVKRILKYGSSQIRSSVIKQFYRHAVKLVSHSISAPIFEYAYSTFASSIEKQHLIQEFFGDIYKSSKDDTVKHLRDVYKNSPEMKAASLGATKANLLKVLNKELLDSGLIQSVLSQYLTECSAEDRAEFISQLAQHAVILSNSKDGARVVMQCVWNGTNKDRKVIMKTVKDHIQELSKHEHGHCTIIALLDAVDDTVLVNKIIIGEIIKVAQELALDEWGRKVLLWLVAPADKAHFHPVFLKELEAGRQSSTTKKAPELRQQELLSYCSSDLLKLIASEPATWLSNASVAVVALAILKAGSEPELKNALLCIAEVIANPEWKIKEGESETSGIEHAGLHMILKKLAQHDSVALQTSKRTFGECLCSKITDETIQAWLRTNRGCFLLVAVIEHGSQETQNAVKEKVLKFKKSLKKQSTAGANILLKKFKA